MYSCRAAALAAFVALALAGCNDMSSPTTNSHPALDQSAAAATAGSQGEWVSTPYGWRLASRGHLIPTGHSISLAANHLQERDSAGNVIGDLGAFASHPGSRIGPPTTLLQQPGIPAGGQQGAGGWIAYAYWDAPFGYSIEADTTRWVVPPAPSTWGNQVIYLFNGLQSSDWILQPVLQWGHSGAGGGSYWSVACWNAGMQGQWDSLMYATTGVERVYPGDTIIGVVDSGSVGWGGEITWTCEVSSTGWNPKHWNILQLSGYNWPVYTQAVETLEAYSIFGCSDYPNTDSTAFRSIAIHTNFGTPLLNWTTEDLVTDCGQHAALVSRANPGGEVDVFYDPPPPPPPPLSVTISGPSSVRKNAECQWTANPSGGVPPYNFSWTPPGTQEDPSVTEAFSSSGTLTVTITDAMNNTTWGSMGITVSSSAPVCNQQ